MCCCCFVLLQVLRDPDQRARYDHQLSYLECRGLVPVQEEVALDEMDQEEEEPGEQGAKGE